MNKLIYISWLLLFSIVISSCRDSEDNPDQGEPYEVELLLVPSGSSSTRTKATTDAGSESERYIDHLDVLLFDGTGNYLYTRQAYRMEGNRFRITLQETDQTLTAYLFANSRDLFQTWAGDNKKWTDVQKELIDINPQRLVGQNTPLPMWGKTSGTVSSSGLNTWGAAQMLRSVASVDLYVKDNDDTKTFKLTGLYLYFSPDRGFLAPGPDETESFATPVGMETSLKLYAGASESPENKNSIAHQLYLYDNNMTAKTNEQRFTRAVMGGEYLHEGNWQAAYYPLDFVNADGSYRPVIRNWKYEFTITGVFGPGYENPDIAAESYPIDLNAEVISWNNDDMDIGVKGHYYVSKERGNMYLNRYAGSSDAIRITYHIYDESTDKHFDLSFADNQNGPKEQFTDGIRNTFFEATLTNNTDTNIARLEVKALQNYDANHDKELLKIRFRDLTFEIAITQYDLDDNDWNWGGNQDEQLEGAAP